VFRKLPIVLWVLERQVIELLMTEFDFLGELTLLKITAILKY